MNCIKNKAMLWGIFAVVALIPGYLIRMNMSISYAMYRIFSTYPGDLQYCWTNYMSKGFSYPIEYPAGARFIFSSLYEVFNLKNNFTLYFNLICGILALCALVTTYYMYKINEQDGNNTQRNLLIYWVLAPSYLFYSMLNFDLLVIITIILGIWFFKQEKIAIATILFALGAATKVFPVFFMPVLFFSVNKRQKVLMVVTFILVWCLVNVPYMVSDFNRWAFPYTWQITSNYAKDMHDGSWTWIVFKLFDSWGIGSQAGKVSLVVFAGLYIYLLKKYWHFDIVTKLLIVATIFILTDRIYSPQYNMYFLAILAICNCRFKLWYFYLLEIPSFIQGFFLFFIKHSGIYLQLIIFIKYLAFILILIDIIRNKSEEPNINKVAIPVMAMTNNK